MKTKTKESLRVTSARIEEEDLVEVVVDLAEVEEAEEVEAEEVDAQDEAPDVVVLGPTIPPTLMEVVQMILPRREGSGVQAIQILCTNLHGIFCIHIILVMLLLSCHYHILF